MLGRFFNRVPKVSTPIEKWNTVTFNWAEDPRIKAFLAQTAPERLETLKPKQLRAVLEQARQIKQLMKRESHEIDIESLQVKMEGPEDQELDAQWSASEERRGEALSAIRKVKALIAKHTDAR